MTDLQVRKSPSEQPTEGRTRSVWKTAATVVVFLIVVGAVVTAAFRWAQPTEPPEVTTSQERAPAVLYADRVLEDLANWQPASQGRAPAALYADRVLEDLANWQPPAAAGPDNSDQAQDSGVRDSGRLGGVIEGFDIGDTFTSNEPTERDSNRQGGVIEGTE